MSLSQLSSGHFPPDHVSIQKFGMVSWMHATCSAHQNISYLKISILGEGYKLKLVSVQFIFDTGHLGMFNKKYGFRSCKQQLFASDPEPVGTKPACLPLESSMDNNGSEGILDVPIDCKLLEKSSLPCSAEILSILWSPKIHCLFTIARTQHTWIQIFFIVLCLLLLFIQCSEVKKKGHLVLFYYRIVFTLYRILPSHQDCEHVPRCV
jgi:hypothetical protein